MGKGLYKGGILDMIIITPHYDEAILEVKIDGKLTKQDIDKFETHYKEAKTEDQKVSLLLEVERINYSLDGLFEDMKFDMKHWNDFDKIAVVSDKKSIELGSKLPNLLPNLEVEHFSLSEKNQARNWLH